MVYIFYVVVSIYLLDCVNKIFPIMVFLYISISGFLLGLSIKFLGSLKQEIDNYRGGGLNSLQGVVLWSL